MVTKKFFRGTFESGFINSSSSSSRSSDISINSLIFPPGGSDGPQQTLFGNSEQEKTTPHTTKNISFFIIDHKFIFTLFFLKLQHRTDKHTHISSIRACVCVYSTVAVPIQLSHHAKDSTSPPLPPHLT